MSFLGGGKKRDLSDGSKSRDGDDSQKVKEQYESINSMPDDVFTDGLSSPNCAKILINCLRNIETQVKDLYDCFDVLKNSHIKGEKQLDSVNESIKHLSDRFDAYEEERDKQNKKIKVLEEKVEKLENESVDDLEQYSRRNCLLLHGVKETDDENTDDIIIKTICEEMGVEVREEDLDRTHRIGRANRSDGKARPVIIKFARYAVRNAVYKNKKLKGKRFLITESLTENRVKALKATQTKYGTTNVWTSNGRIFYKCNNKVHKV